MTKSVWKRKRRYILKLLPTFLTVIGVTAWEVARKKWSLDSIWKGTLSPETETALLLISGYLASINIVNVFAQDELVGLSALCWSVRYTPWWALVRT